MPAWASMWNAVTSGNIGEATDYLFIDQRTVDTLNVNATSLEAAARRLQQDGVIGAQESAKLISNAQLTAYPYVNAGQSPSAAFIGGVAEDFKGGFGKALGIVTGNIPWQVYLIGGIVLLIFIWPYAGPSIMKGFSRK